MSKMDQEPDYGDEPLSPPTPEEEHAEAWEYWHQRACRLEAINADLLAALKWLVEEVTNGAGDETVQAVGAAYAAITKAEDKS
jgi:hypothetical protein